MYTEGYMYKVGSITTCKKCCPQLVMCLFYKSGLTVNTTTVTWFHTGLFVREWKESIISTKYQYTAQP